MNHLKILLPRSCRTSLQLAEQKRQGGISTHISPMTDSPSLSGLLNRANFSLATVDVDEMTIAYPSIFELCQDLKAMGEQNCLKTKKLNLGKRMMEDANSIYKGQSTVV
jgi:NADH dehydrogenase [ubiquinone] 1 alpha subcomplex assembly factor 5